MSSVPVSFPRKCAAWGVHLLTATGAAAGLMAIVATTQYRWIAALSWMGVTILIDSIDGTLARWCRVKEVLPQFDGALLDNIVDYFTYVIVPAFFFYMADLMPARLGLPAAVAVTLASGYQFCQADAKTDDHYFKGFPSYWNVVALYLFLLGLSRWMNLVIVLALTVTIFVPIKYLYPSRTETLRSVTLLLTAIWAALAGLALLRYPEGHEIFLRLSLMYLAYYFGISLFLNLGNLRHPA